MVISVCAISIESLSPLCYILSFLELIILSLSLFLAWVGYLHNDLHHILPNQKNHCGDKKQVSSADFTLFFMRCMLVPHMVHLGYTLTPQTLQYFPCLLTVSDDFSCFSIIFRLPQRYYLLPLYVLVLSDFFLYSIIQGYSCDDPPLFIFPVVVVILLWAAKLCFVAWFICEYPGYLLRRGD